MILVAVEMLIIKTFFVPISVKKLLTKKIRAVEREVAYLRVSTSNFLFTQISLQVLSLFDTCPWLRQWCFLMTSYS